MRDESCELLCLDLPHAEQVRAQLLSRMHAQLAAQQVKALADASRLRLATALAVGGELCVCDLAWICGQGQNLVSHHLRILRTAELVSTRRDGKLMMYRLSVAGTRLLAHFSALPSPVPGAVASGEEAPIAASSSGDAAAGGRGRG